MEEAASDLRKKLAALEGKVEQLQRRTSDPRRSAQLTLLLVSCRDARHRLNATNPRNLAMAVDDVRDLLQRADAVCRFVDAPLDQQGRGMR